jgi:transcription antitermination factor NusG
VIGERVSISDGPFAGLSGVVLRRKGSVRVVITLDLLMQSMVVEVEIEDVEPLRKPLQSVQGPPLASVPKSQPEIL